tara:strand:+ start:7740 stop:8117 length:378 start_codon:yes stop_codon:yes gene_type:complete
MKSVILIFLFSFLSFHFSFSQNHCDVWKKINEWVINDNGTNLTTKEGWDTRIKLTQELVNSLPDNWKDVGIKYLSIVIARAKLLSDNEYISVMSLPFEVRSSFISKHFTNQKEANKLIAFLKNDC